MSPSVSIIAPTYNHEAYIKECVDSVIEQTFSDWEMIIIDDHSTDRTSEILADFVRRDSRIKVIRHEENWGAYRLVDSYNQALENAKGKYIAVIEGDDFWPRDKLELQVREMENKPAAILSYGCGVELEDGEEGLLGDWAQERARDNQPVGAILKLFLAGKNRIPAQTVMMRTDVLVKAGGFHPKGFPLFLIDYPTWMELALQGEFLFIPKILGYWRRHEAQLTAVKQEKMLEEHVRYIRFFLEQNKERLQKLNIKDIEAYLEGPAYFLLFTLCRMKIIGGNLLGAKQVFKDMKPAIKTIQGNPKELVKTFVLFLSLYAPVVYFTAKKIREIGSKMLIRRCRVENVKLESQ